MPIVLIDRISQKNNGTYKLVLAKDIDWTGFTFPADLITNLIPPASPNNDKPGIVKVGSGINVDANGTITAATNSAFAVNKSIDVLANTEVGFTDLTIGKGVVPRVGDIVIDKFGEIYPITAVAADKVTVGGTVTTPKLATKSIAGAVIPGGDITLNTANGTINVLSNVANGFIKLDKDTKVGIKLDYATGGSINASTLEGKNAKYFEDKINSTVNGIQWRPSVANAAALKALTAPQEGWTVSVNDTNLIYRFDAANTATADNPNGELLIANDKTKGAWILLGNVVYHTASSTADGLMAKEDKAYLDKVKTWFDGETGKAKTAENAEKLGGHTPDYYAIKPANIAFTAAQFGKADADGYVSVKVTLTPGQKVMSVVRDDADKSYEVMVDVELAKDGTSATVCSSEAFAGHLEVVA